MPSTTSLFAFLNRPVVVAVVSLGVTALGLPVNKPAKAADVVSLTVSPSAEAATIAYWTPERYANAKPMVMISKGKLGAAKQVEETAKPSAPVPGGAPTLPYDPAMAVDLYTPKAAAPESGVAPALIGTGGFPFTVNRLYPVPDTFKTFPYALVGQLFFTNPRTGEDFLCSASVIRFRVIVTAGHCVADGKGHFFANWVFVPAASFGHAPFGGWRVSSKPGSVVTTKNWFFGGGTVPNIQDDAVIVLNDKFIHGLTQRIGDLTGFFGFQYNAPLPTHITQLGYPFNLDRSSDPIANYAQVLNIDTNNFEWGSAEMGGASGGPVVQDFGVAPAGTPPEIGRGNVAVAVLSFGFIDTSVLVDGGSIFGRPGEFHGGTFGDLINEVCKGPGTSGNCT